MTAPTHRLLSLASLAFVLLSSASPCSAQSAPNAAAPLPTAAPSSPPAGNSDNDPAGAESFDLESALVTPDQGFTSEEAGRRARERSPQIAAAQASASSAAWDVKAQAANFLPQLTAYAQYKRIKRIENSIAPTGDPEQVEAALGAVEDPVVRELFGGLLGGFSSSSFTQPVDNYTVAASVRVPVSELFLRVLPTYKSAGQIADARTVEIDARKATIDLQAREAFYAYARARATHLVAEQAFKQAEAQAAQAKLFVDAGTAAPVDLMTATARVESMRGSLARTRGAVAVTRNTLATLTGLANAELPTIREPVTTLPAAPDKSVEELLKRALEQRAELRAMRKMVGANDSLKSAERNAALPTLAVEGSVLSGRPNPRYIPPNTDRFRNSWEIGATLAWSPNSAIVGYQRSQRASVEVAKARADLAALEDGVRIEVVQAFEDYQAADAAARASEAQQRAAEETYRVRLATYRVGAGVQIDLLTADLALTQARLDYVNAVLDARTSLARLSRAVGVATDS
jgi:outer membrane protein